ncbi:serine hydrolase [Microbacterium sp. NPDC055910]|uniref:serine hydrolase n=1 Tax=Microbacterium sp. NPDC055910 TaxID=3345659 RepID=UPI0035E38ED6
MVTFTDKRPIRRAAAGFAAAVLALALAACAVTPDAPTETFEIPDTAVGSQAQWVLDEINADAVSDAAEIEERFDPVMLEEVSVEDLRSILGQMQDAKPWRVETYDGGDEQARVRIASSAAEYDMTVSVGSDGRMNGLFFGMPQPDRVPAASWDELRAEIEALPYDASLQVRTVGSDAPDELIGDASAAPIGSIFKLYVLGAVVDAVERGDLAWETPLTIDGEVRSLPSGELQDLPDGSTVTALEAAEKMIAISDNTATDALIRAVGREAAEAALAEMGHHDPAINTPFVTTRELFWLGWADPSLRERWADAATPAEREAILADVPAGVPDIASGDWAVTAWQSGVDWFATPDDIARAHIALQERASTDAGAPVRGILSANPGLDLGEEWSYVGYKGGSSIGVLAGSWYLERDGAEPVVLTAFARSDDPAAVADPTAFFAIAEDAAALLAAG